MEVPVSIPNPQVESISATAKDTTPCLPKPPHTSSLLIGTVTDTMMLSHPAVSDTPVLREIRETPTKKTVVLIRSSKRLKALKEKRLSENAPYPSLPPLLRGLSPNDSDNERIVQNLSVTVKQKKLEFSTAIPVLPPAVIQIKQSKNSSNWEFIKLKTENYCSMTYPFVCSKAKCGLSYSLREQMDTHLIASHSGHIRICDLTVAIQARYHSMNTLDMSMPAKALPKLDPAIVEKMSQNLEAMKSSYERFIRMKRKYYCVICQNFYSNQRLVLEHLVGKRHKLVADQYNN